MRGFDYRCAAGIALLITKKLDNKRAFLQAMGRVGRMGDEAQWYKLPQVGDGFDEPSIEALKAMASLQKRAMAIQK